MVFNIKNCNSRYIFLFYVKNKKLKSFFFDKTHKKIEYLFDKTHVLSKFQLLINKIFDKTFS